MYKLLNYLGQLRLYSLANLMFMLVVAGASWETLRFWSAVGLWVGFLAYLESHHRHEGRARIPEKWAWYCWIGVLLIQPHASGIVAWMMALSAVYSWQKTGYWGLVSPIVRGLQTIVLVWGFPTPQNRQLLVVIASAMTIRNIFGDARDTSSDRAAEMKTWPVVLKMGDHLFLHWIAVMATTWLWWWFSGFSVWVPLGLNVLETSTYWRTTRPNNKEAKKAVLRLRNKILSIFQR